ncbi:MAG: hypothetical protein ALECFALPRED_001974 [Alectoria fallacina]|uniref:Galactose oxidase n=1 Tax=Alectoria fallacina TaxID=1903189 RepID=A0A8H3FCA6_9LECA|nr:MAG: hypothetical protein ALECFALPRED_001974 [Alectoria fallacina]
MLRLLALVLTFSSLSHAKPISAEAANAGAASNSASTQGQLATEGTTTYDGVELASIPAAPAVSEVIAAAISQAGWTIVVDSQNTATGNLGTNAIDGNTSTFWHSEYQPVLVPLPHNATIDMKTASLVGSITYLPRQDGQANGRIGEHIIQLSPDGVTYTTVAIGTWIDDATLKTTTFTPFTARYVRIQALSEAGNRGPWSSAAEINVYTAAGAAAPSPVGKGAWVLTVDFPLVPVSIAHEWSTGQILAWSSYTPSSFGGSPGTTTYTATYNPATQLVTQAIITNVDHDMFCEGLSLDFNGRIIATGGNTDAATSSYDPTANDWTAEANLNIPRGYQAQATTSNGNLFTIGASWSGGQGGKNGELYNPTANTWTELAGCPVAPMLTADAQGVYRADNHGWLFGWSSGYVFQGGPSKAMNWYLSTETGGQTGVGNRASDTDSMCGNAVMFDAVAGKILTVGGSPDYQDSNSTANAHIITIGTPPATPTVQTIGSMAYARAFANSVVLPDGTVLVVGGQISAVPFSDATSQYTPELFNPATNTFTQVAPISIPRNYHSVAILLFDGTVGNGGGGLCGTCATNHFDMQIWNPPYLYTTSGALATRPIINSISVASVANGGTFSITTNVACTAFSMIRMSSTTHTVNTDQRRIALTPTSTAGTTYTFTVPTDPGVALPGHWMVWALAGGVPSVSMQLQVT